MKLKHTPVAIHREGSDGESVLLVRSFEFEDLDGITLANLDDGDTIRSWPVREIVHQDPSEMMWIGIEGSLFTARAIRPPDAKLAGIYGYDLPVKLLEAMTFGQVENPMELQAVVDRDDNRVLTLLLASDAGLFARYDRLWHPVVEPDIFDGTELVNVHEDAIQLYDAADQIGGQVAANLLPTGRNTLSGETLPPPDSDPMVASAPIYLPIIDTADDLNEAITAAADDPETRWYIEKRASALGLEVTFPWQE
jgi:hypothetical protein